MDAKQSGLLEGFRAPLKGFGVYISRFCASPYEKHMAVFINWGVHFLGALKTRAYYLGSILRP